MLHKGDIGLSLGDLIEQIYTEYPADYPLLMHIETISSHIEKERLYEDKYDSVYLKTMLRYYDAINIPHFNEKTPDGVFNAEYDCVLDNAVATSEEEMISWIREG